MRKKELRLILSCCAVSVAAIMVAFTAFAATINVPAEYESIQGAVDSASAGDTVLCQPGTYTPVSFLGKAITVECAGSPGSCVIDCDDISSPSDSWGVIFSSYEGPDSVLTGFTIRDCDEAAILCGRPIKTVIAGATPSGPGSPTIANCNMEDNGFWLDESFCGGIEAYDSSPTLIGCTIQYNSAEFAGGGCFFGGSPTLTGCTISYNSALSNGNGEKSTSRGAAIIMGAPSAGGIVLEGSSPTITGCTVSYNSGGEVGGIAAGPSGMIEPLLAAPNGGAFTLSGTTVTFNSGYYTGGILTRDESPTITDCNVSYNWAWGWDAFPYTVGGVNTWGGSPTISGGNVSYNTAEGVGGIQCIESIASPTISGVTVDNNEGGVGGISFFYSAGTIEDCNVTGNVARGCGGPHGCHVGGIAVLGTGDVEINRTYVSQNQGFVGGIGATFTNSPSVTNSMITGNTGYVGGIGCDEAEILLTNCTIADNDGNAEGVGGIGSPDDSAITVVNSILWGNSPNQVDTGVAPSITYSDVQGGHAGAGNINADPMFLGPGDYHIFLASPCVDVATPTGAPADDIDGDLRPQGAGYDMGADENLPDDDGDGVPSAYEMGPEGDPGYDGNNDGYPDWTQGNVSSFPTVDGGNYVTIECPDPSFFVNVAAAPNPSPGNTPPGVTFPYGFFSFRINNLPTGGATTVTIYLSGPALDDYWKYGRTPDDPANHWYLFPLEEDADGDVTGAENIGDTVIRLNFVDGKRGDNDLTANATVIDPGAPGVPGAADVFNPEAGAEDKSDSVCFIGTAADSFGF